MFQSNSRARKIVSDTCKAYAKTTADMVFLMTTLFFVNSTSSYSHSSSELWDVHLVLSLEPPCRA